MIIGLSGYARSGKNVIAGLLGAKYKQVAFADPIRKALITINPLAMHPMYGGHVPLSEIVEEMGWDRAKNEIPETRRMLQILGTEVGRHIIHDNVWVDIALRGMIPEDNVVFTDVRFLNEAVAIKNMRGEVWRVSRNGVGAVNEHKSETMLDDWHFDRVIENNGTIEQLQIEIQELSLLLAG